MKENIEDIEIKFLLDGVFKIYGYDFRDYAYSSIRRRVLKCVEDLGLKTVSGLSEKIFHDKQSFQKFLNTVTIEVTSMFRDPLFFKVLREKVFPNLHNLKFIRIWNMGCSTGEEAYSLAILLREEGLYDKSKIYATDLNKNILEKAKEGVFSFKNMKAYTKNYLESGGRSSFSDYYTAKYDNAILHKEIKKNIVWAEHNLVTDASFNEFNLILCRNVLIYFNQVLQEKVFELIYQSLTENGYLGLGSRETIRFTPREINFRILSDTDQPVYIKIN